MNSDDSPAISSARAVSVKSRAMNARLSNVALKMRSAAALPSSRAFLRFGELLSSLDISRSPVLNSKSSTGASPFSSHAKLARLMLQRVNVLVSQRTFLPARNTSGTRSNIRRAIPLCSAAPRAESSPYIPACASRMTLSFLKSARPSSVRIPAASAFAMTLAA